MTGGRRTLLNVALLVLLILFAMSLLYAFRSQSPSPQSISPLSGMPSAREAHDGGAHVTQEIDVNIPAAKWAVIGEFGDREAAEAAVQALLAAGYTDDQLNVVARGADGSGDEFRPGALMVTARCSGKEDIAERIMREHDARSIRRDEVSATGEVDES